MEELLGISMKKLLAYLFRYPLVYTQDMDGEIRLRIPRKTVFNNYVVNGIDGQIASAH